VCEFENRGFINEQRLVGRACMCVNLRTGAL